MSEHHHDYVQPPVHHLHTVNVVIHDHREHGILETILNTVTATQQKVSQLMAISAETRAVIDRLNTATNAIAARLKALSDQIAAGGMSADDEAAAVAELNALASNLEGMGTDPNNPIPPAPPVTPTP